MKGDSDGASVTIGSEINTRVLPWLSHTNATAVERVETALSCIPHTRQVYFSAALQGWSQIIRHIKKIRSLEIST